MKLKEKQHARLLRKKGSSLNEIASMLNVSKGSVSTWVSDIPLTNDQLSNLKQRSHTEAVIESRRRSRIQNEEARRISIRNKARAEIRAVNKSQLLHLGLALYWGEGTKKKRGVVEFTNSDPQMIKAMMKFFRHMCDVPTKKFRGRVLIHEHLPILKAEQYWSRISGIPLTQFHKTSIQQNRKRVHKDTLPLGTFAIIVCDTELKLKIMGWIDGISDNF